MHVIRLKRGWRLRATDNEFELLRAVVKEGRRHFGTPINYKQQKVMNSAQWQSDDPLCPDEDRRDAASN